MTALKQDLESARDDTVGGSIDDLRARVLKLIAEVAWLRAQSTHAISLLKPLAGQVLVGPGEELAASYVFRFEMKATAGELRAILQLIDDYETYEAA